MDTIVPSRLSVGGRGNQLLSKVADLISDLIFDHRLMDYTTS